MMGMNGSPSGQGFFYSQASPSNRFFDVHFQNGGGVLSEQLSQVVAPLHLFFRSSVCDARQIEGVSSKAGRAIGARIRLGFECVCVTRVES